MPHTQSYLDVTQVGCVDLPALEGLAPSKHIIDAEAIDAINVALATRRPLLVRGEPGTGKSQLARAAAVLLKRAFLPYAVDARTETRDLLWTIDSVARLATAQVMSAAHNVGEEEVLRRIDVLKFVRPGPIWWAFDWNDAWAQATDVKSTAPPTPEEWAPEQGTVVLIDEIDKADSSVPNGLLDALGHGRFDVQGRCKPVKMNVERVPLIVMTTNEERSLPDAFLRRCLVLHLELPDKHSELIAKLVTCGRAHFATCAETVLLEAAEQLAKDRDKHREHDLTPPGLAEYIDLLGALTAQYSDETAQRALLKRISRFVFEKHPKERMR